LYTDFREFIGGIFDSSHLSILLIGDESDPSASVLRRALPRHAMSARQSALPVF
jgi:hypothetical protein